MKRSSSRRAISPATRSHSPRTNPCGCWMAQPCSVSYERSNHQPTALNQTRVKAPLRTFPRQPARNVASRWRSARPDAAPTLAVNSGVAPPIPPAKPPARPENPDFQLPTLNITPHSALRVPHSALRICTDPKQIRQVVLNNHGPTLSAAQIQRIIHQLDQKCRDVEL
jgi:hypothetical protein